MNTHDRQLHAPPRPLLVSDILYLVDRGVIHEDAKFELIRGVVEPHRSPKGPLHEDIKRLLTRWLVTALGERFDILPETTLYVSDDTFFEPDFAIITRGRDLEGLRGPDVALLIEVADISARWDRGGKARLYAEYGVPEYWAVDAAARGVRIHRGPSSNGGWSEVLDLSATEPISPSCAPDVRLVMSDLS